MNAVDYLMKPFSKDRLDQAIDKVVDRFSRKISEPSSLKKLVENLHEQQDTIERIVVKKRLTNSCYTYFRHHSA